MTLRSESPYKQIAVVWCNIWAVRRVRWKLQAKRFRELSYLLAYFWPFYLPHIDQLFQLIFIAICQELVIADTVLLSANANHCFGSVAISWRRGCWSVDGIIYRELGRRGHREAVGEGQGKGDAGQG